MILYQRYAIFLVILLGSLLSVMGLALSSLGGQSLPWFLFRSR